MFAGGSDTSGWHYQEPAVKTLVTLSIYVTVSFVPEFMNGAGLFSEAQLPEFSNHVES
jgi:hypothetical protein